MQTRYRPEPVAILVPLRKRADLGGPGNDSSFEQSFSNLATSYLVDKAPSLLEHEIGFQLVDRDEEHNKAVGVFGFKAGPLWLYAPVFFVAGDLKGHELLYVKNQDQFVPLEEGWINDLLAKVPVELGQSVDRSGRQMGVRYPDLQRALEGPRKYAALVTPEEHEAVRVEAEAVMAKAGSSAAALAGMPDWAKVAVASLAAASLRDRPAAPARLLDLVADGGVKMAAALARHLDDYPRLRAGFDAFYAPEAVDRAVATAKTASAPRPVRPAPPRLRPGTAIDAIDAERHAAVHAKVAVHRFNAWSPASPLLDDAEKEELVARGLLIKDARGDDEVCRAYAIPVRLDFTTTFTNPDASGLYRVLTKDGSTEDCLVLMGPMGPGGPQPWSTVVCLDSKKKDFLNVHASRVWTVRREFGAGGNGGGQDGSHWFDDLPDVDAKVTDSAHYIAVGRSGAATTPFRLLGDAGRDAGGGKSYKVLFDTWAPQGRSIANRAAGVYFDRADAHDHTPGELDRIHLGQRTGSMLRARSGDVFVPESFKLIRLAPDKGTDGGDPHAMDGRSDGAEALRLGDALSVEDGILRKTAGLLVTVDGARATVDGRAMAAKEALVHLVTGRGLREDNAREVLEAGEKSWRLFRKAAGFRVKQADPYRGAPYLTDGGPTAPGVMDPPPAPDGTFGGQVAAHGPFEQAYPVPDLLPMYGNQDSYQGDNAPDPRAMQVAQNASQQGQREVFDTAMVSSMLRTTSDDGLVDKYMKSLMKALDSLGRMVFNLHWHGERFAERYGEGEMPELEDSLRNTFEATGKLILFLRRKTTVAAPDEDAQAEDLDEVADR